jgi:HEAT repeat protein
MVVGMLLLGTASAGADHVGDLVVTLREGQADQRREACDGLVALGPAAARVALPDLLAALRDQHWDGRSSVPPALLQIAPDDPAVRAALAEAATDPIQDIREAIASALEDHAPQETLKEMIPLLVRLLRDKERSVASEAASAVARLGPDGAAAAPALLEAMKRKDAGLRLRAASALAGIGGEVAKPAVPMLRAMLGSSDKSDRSSAAQVLGELGAIGADGAPELTTALADSEPWVRLQAAIALGRIGQPATVMAGKDQQLRAAFDLGAILAKGGTEPEALLKLLEMTKTKDLKIRMLAHDAVRAGGDAAVPGLVMALNSTVDEIRAGAAVALSILAHSLTVRAGAHAEAAAAALAERLTKDADPVTRATAASALQAFG